MATPKPDKEREERERLKRLEREGKIKLGTGKIPEEFWKLPRPEDPEGLAVRYLIEDRKQGR
ncbi:MAG: hypothetical protein LC781_19785 [Actinobacteria bacterium]|nr:hypothetical protein [Actinomycetota bacterium]